MNRQIQVHEEVTGAEVEREQAVRIRARDVRKTYSSQRGGEVVALDGVSLDIKAGQMAVLLGPSGCGKTTLLRSIAGLEQPQGGDIEIDGTLVYSASRKTWIPPERRQLSMVFQSYALWPHMTVFENVAFPLRSRRTPKDRIRGKVLHVLEAVGLSGYEQRHPSQLSGGQQQRVALARAIVADVGVVLFDEPLSNVDAKVREQVRNEIVALQSTFGFAGLYVTHDQVEAGALAEVLVVMDHGRIEQTGRPQELYDAPASRYVANFMGTISEISGSVSGINASGVVTLQTALGPISGTASASLAVGSEVVAAFRPERALLSYDEPGDTANVWRCAVKHKMFMGSYMEVLLDIMFGDERCGATVTAPRGSGFREGSEAWIHVPVESMLVLNP
ncbi:ABC transporter ATP-binding protein [Ornithinimicrobium murale]|uniref:ABC transporter ATP-binding protein n=1 Tax=Ornithinimicrobium murale TaxID=1050153 RepID=UPI0013B42D8A|nr:ABC transporter ATP-binding protein [Ornithinimicrobium murale]